LGNIILLFIKKEMNILGHAPFIGSTGYANHSRLFFCALNKYHTVKIRNSTIGAKWAGFNNEPHSNEHYFNDEIRNMLILQTLINSDGSRSDFPIYGGKKEFKPDVHIILTETDGEYFYQDYDGFKIAYNVWESTRYPERFFKRLFYFDQVWVPSKWQQTCLIEQGYPAEKIFVVPEGVDVDVFKPLEQLEQNEKFRFLHFGRWDYRKSTTEILRTFSETFKDIDNVELICSIENPYAVDGLKTTEDRFVLHNIDTSKIKNVGFVSSEEYVKYFQNGNVFVSCARSEGWNLPLIDSMSCGTPSIYSNCSGQLEFAENKGIPVNIAGYRPANIERSHFPGEYAEPDFNDLAIKMMDAYTNFKSHKEKALEDAKIIHQNFNWDLIAQNASKILEDIDKKKYDDFVYITSGNLSYMPIIEKLVQSLMFFSKRKIIVYGIDCEVPFNYSNVIKRTIHPPHISEHDKWYWKQYACIESVNEDYDNFIWIDGDVVANHNIDNIKNHFSNIENYPIPDVHVQNEFFGFHDVNKSQLFSEEIARKYNIIPQKQQIAHICFYIYNKKCKWWFEEILEVYKESLNDYKRYLLWNDEGADNLLRWKYNFNKYLPLSNFDTSAYDGNLGNMNSSIHDFLKFWNEEGPINFDRIYGYQYIPKDKSNIIYFHGNKHIEVANKMIEFIKMKKDNSFYNSEYFYTDIYNLENFGDIKNVEGSTLEIAHKYGWGRAIYHEIYNLQDYYNDRVRKIKEGDIVVDLGGNIGVFNRWAYSQGASKVISFEPDKRYFKLLKLNAHPNSILFNAAISDKTGTIQLYESPHLGGSNILQKNTNDVGNYKIKTYTLNNLFDIGLISKIDFLKVDIEGAEIMAFQGISDENLLKITNISMEYHHSHLHYNNEVRQNLITRLNKLGFNSYLIFLGNNNDLQLIHFWR
jgi:FkbM family methyltransferase